MPATAVRVRSLNGGVQTAAELASHSSLASTRLLRELTLAGASLVLSRRASLPAHCFRPAPLGPLLLPPAEQPDPRAARLHKLLAAAASAIDHTYLKKLVINFYHKENDPESLLEKYTFRYNYHMDKPEMTLKKTSKDKSTTVAITDSTQKMLECLMTICDNITEKLPESFYYKFDLTYYDDVTPEDYEPEGFAPDTLPYIMYRDRRPPIKVGNVATPYHDISMNSFFKDPEIPHIPSPIYNESPVYDFIPDKSPVYDVVHDASPVYDVNYEENMTEDAPEMNCSQATDCSFFNIENQNQLKPTSPYRDSQNSSDIRCPCGISTDDEQFLLKCEQCGYRQHAICFGTLNEIIKYIIKHYCNICAAENSDLKCTDPNLLYLDSRQKADLCQLRKALAYCIDESHINLSMIETNMKTPKNVAVKIMDKLNRCHAFYSPTSHKPLRMSQYHLVNKSYLMNTLIPKYFLTLENQTPIAKSHSSKPVNIEQNNKTSNTKCSSSDKRDKDYVRCDNLRDGTSRNISDEDYVRPDSISRYGMEECVVKSHFVRRSTRKQKYVCYCEDDDYDDFI